MLAPCFHYLLRNSSSLVLCLLTLLGGHVMLSPHVFPWSFCSSVFWFSFFSFFAQPGLHTFHVTASLKRLEIIITVLGDLWLESSKPVITASVNLNGCCDLFVRNSKWVAREGRERMLTDYFCLLSAPEYKLGFFQLCLSLTWVCLLL